MPDTGRFRTRLQAVGGFTYRLLWVCYGFAVILSLASVLSPKAGRWYSGEVTFSDWREAGKLDFATNAVVSNWYSGGKAQMFRADNIENINKFLQEHGEATVGADYYALTGVCAGLFPQEFLMDNFGALKSGRVMTMVVRTK